MSAPSRVLLLVNKPAARNPVVLMYFEALYGRHEVTVACPDPDATAAALPGVRTQPLHGDSALLRWRGRLGALRRRLRGGAPAAAAPAVAPAPDAAPEAAPRAFSHVKPRAVGRRRVDAQALRVLVADAATMAAAQRARGRHDVIVAIDADVLLAAWLLGTVWRAPYAYFMYEVWPFEYPYFPPNLSYTRALVERFGVRRAQRSIVSDPVHGRVLRWRYGLPASGLAIIPTCPALPPVPAERPVGEPMRFYYHGGLQHGRGIENLVRAMRDVPGAALAIRGLGPLEATLRTLIDSEGLADRVTLLPPVGVAEIAASATAFDVGVNVTCQNSANHRFNVGFKTFENLAAGVALLSTASRPLGRFIREHDVGHTFEDCSTAAIAEAMRHCVADPARVLRWKQRARALAERRFNSVTQGDAFRAVIEELAGARAAVAAPAREAAHA